MVKSSSGMISSDFATLVIVDLQPLLPVTVSLISTSPDKATFISGAKPEYLETLLFCVIIHSRTTMSKPDSFVFERSFNCSLRLSSVSIQSES